ncbi:hypothetical protein ACFOHS_11545 [Jhaorihella thermophila]
MADDIAQGPREAQGVIRRLVARAYDVTEEEQLIAERNAMACASGGDEAAEGIAAFLEKNARRTLQEASHDRHPLARLSRPADRHAPRCAGRHRHHRCAVELCRSGPRRGRAGG